MNENDFFIVLQSFSITLWTSDTIITHQHCQWEFGSICGCVLTHACVSLLVEAQACYFTYICISSAVWKTDQREENICVLMHVRKIKKFTRWHLVNCEATVRCVILKAVSYKNQLDCKVRAWHPSCPVHCHIAHAVWIASSSKSASTKPCIRLTKHYAHTDWPQPEVCCYETAVLGVQRVKCWPQMDTVVECTLLMALPLEMNQLQVISSSLGDLPGFMKVVQKRCCLAQEISGSQLCGLWRTSIYIQTQSSSDREKSTARAEG